MTQNIIIPVMPLGQYSTQTQKQQQGLLLMHLSKDY